MSVGAGELAALLGRMRGVDEFALTEMRRLRSRRQLGADGGARDDHERRLEAELYRDLRRGRGSSRASFEGLDRAQARARAATAAGHASRARGPSWRLPSAAAPARVSVSDPRIVAGPARAVDELVAAFVAALPREAELVRGFVEAEVAEVEARASSGFANRYRATRVHWRLALAVGDRLAVTGEGAARRLDDVDAAAEIASLVGRAAAPIEPAAPGRYDLLLRAQALAPLTPRWGWWAPLVAQADAGLVRQGLSRYRPGQPIHPGAIDGDALDLTSDGTLPFALESAPFADGGDPVRRVPLVRGGVAAGLLLDRREAALLDRSPNGGARNLVVGGGSRDPAELEEPGARPLLVVDDLAWLESAPDGVIAAGLGASAVPGAGRRWGGTVAVDAFGLWSRARMSRDRVRRGWYDGPAAIRFDDVPLVG